MRAVVTFGARPADSSLEEVIRNVFIRQPALWIDTSATPARGKVAGS